MNSSVSELHSGAFKRIPPVGTLSALGADFSLARQAGGLELHQVASVGHQPPVSSLPTVDAHLVSEGEAHLRRIFHVRKLRNSEVLQRHFWDSFETGDSSRFWDSVGFLRYYGNNSVTVNCNIMG